MAAVITIEQIHPARWNQHNDSLSGFLFQKHIFLNLFDLRYVMVECKVVNMNQLGAADLL